MDRHGYENTKVCVAGSIPTVGNLFAQINLTFTMKQNKMTTLPILCNDGKTRLSISSRLSC